MTAPRFPTLKAAFLSLLMTSLAGCTDVVPVPLVYEPPSANDGNGCVVVGVRPVTDKRPIKDIDKHIASSVSESVRRSIESEFSALANVAKVVRVGPHSPASHEVDYVVDTTVQLFGNTVPDRGGRMAGIVVGAVLLGNLGAAAAGQGDTIVEGYAALDVTILDVASSESRDRQFLGRSKLSVPASYMDTSQTKSRATGMALKDALSDLDKIWNGREHDCTPKRIRTASKPIPRSVIAETGSRETATTSATTSGAGNPSSGSGVSHRERADVPPPGNVAQEILDEANKTSPLHTLCGIKKKSWKHEAFRDAAIAVRRASGYEKRVTRNGHREAKKYHESVYCTGAAKVASPRSGQRLSADDLRSEWPSYTAILSRAVIYFDNDGTMRGALKDGSSSDTGTYKITNNDMLCFTWKKWRGAKTSCFSVQRTGDKFEIIKPDGGISQRFKKVPGNPHRL